MKNLFLSFIMVLCAILVSRAQVSVNTDNSDPDPAAMLDVKSSDKGVLIPRVALVSTTDPISMAKPEGLLVWNTSTTGNYPQPGFYHWDGSDWVKISTGSGASGSYEIVDSDNDTRISVEYTTDEDTIRFFVAGSEVMKHDGKTLHMTDVYNNVFLGNHAGEANVDGEFNLAIGGEALKDNTIGDSNIAIGGEALEQNTAGNGNIAVGNRALFKNDNGFGNTAIGSQAGYQNISGDNNVFLGKFAGYNETGNHKLYIENSQALPEDALIYGDFDNDQLTFNGKVGVNTTNPATELDVDGEIRSSKLAGGGNRLVQADGNGILGTLTIPDSISIDPSPVLLDCTGWGLQYFEAVVIRDDIAFVVGNLPSKLITFDISDPENISFLDENSSSLSGTTSVFVDGNYAYVTNNSTYGLVIFDISDPQNIQYVGAASSEIFRAYDVFVSNGYAYIASKDNHRLVVYDVSNPASPVLAGYTSNSLIQPTAVRIWSIYAFVSSSGNDKIVIYSVFDPANPAYVGEFSAGLDEPCELVIWGGYAYIASKGNDKLVIADILPPNSPVFVSELSAGISNPGSIDKRDDIVFIGNEEPGGFVLFDVSDNLNPFKISGLTSVGNDVYDIVAADGFVSICKGGALCTYNLSNSAYPFIGPDGSVSWTSADHVSVWELNDTTQNIHYNNGNVGINTDNPTQWLDVNGEARIRTIYNNNTYDDVLVRNPDGVIYRRDAYTLADNLGNHTATQNINLNGNLLTGDGGIDINIASGDGIYIDSTVNKGVRVYHAGNPSSHYPLYYSPLNNGFEVNGAEGNGLYVGQADKDGVCVFKAGNPQDYNANAWGNGFEVAGAEGHGLWVGWAGQTGVCVGEAITGVSVGNVSGQGVSVNRAGNPSSMWDTYNSDGFNVAGAEGNGLYIGHADLDGVIVRSAGGNLFQGGNNGSEVFTVSNTGDVTATSFTGDGSGLTGISGDNLGNHTATQNINLNGNLLTGNGGIDLGNAADDGIKIYGAGSPSAYQTSTHINGFEVAGAQGYGLFVGRSDNDGVYIHNAGDEGININSATGEGVYINSAGDDGVLVVSAGNPSTSITSSQDNGFSVYGAQGHGLFVGRADYNGVSITETGDDGVYVHDAGDNGVIVRAAAGNLFQGGDDGSEVFTVSNTGAVTAASFGVGTSSPSELLHIYENHSSNYTAARLENAAAPGQGGAQFEIKTDGNQFNLGVGGSGNSSLGSKFYIYQQSAGARMVIDGNGRMGIGTTSPSNPLQIRGAGTSSGGNSTYAEVVSRFTNTNSSEHTAISIDALSGYDPILYLGENGGAMWSMRCDNDDYNRFEIRYHVGGVNETFLRITDYGRLELDEAINPVTDNMHNLGFSSTAYKNIYSYNFVDVSKTINIDIGKQMDYGLNSLLGIESVFYTANADSQQLSTIGLNPEELYKVIPEAVAQPEEPGGNWGIRYNQLIPVLIKGIQEQQAQLDMMESENTALKEQLENFAERLETLENR
ncbi:MAG: hypothetical protein JW861_02890 [Bacteroidales bacterium]|nr:hypothetical protein [Bacteroidales bacterium]